MTEKANPPSGVTERKKFFIDTEFIESGPSRPIELLSIGIVCEDGREFYTVDDGAVLANANAWVRENVIPHLGGPHMNRVMIRRGILNFVGDCKPEFWGYYADYDWVVFCQIFGAMVDLPKGWPMFCRDLKQLCVDCGNPELPKQSSKEHNALNDAHWNRKAYEFLGRISHAPKESNPPSNAPEGSGQPEIVIDLVKEEMRTINHFSLGGKSPRQQKNYDILAEWLSQAAPPNAKPTKDQQTIEADTEWRDGEAHGT